MFFKLNFLLVAIRFKEYYGQALLMASLGLLFVNSYEQSHVVFVMLGVLLACCGLFMFNNIEDAQDDILVNAKKKVNAVSSQMLSIKNAYLIALISLLVACVLFFAVGIFTGVLGLGMILLGLLYSWRPVRLKSVPILDIVSHSLVASLAFVLGSLVGQVSISPNYFVMFFAVFMLSAVGDMNNEIRDYDVDRLTGIKNTASKFNLSSITKVLSLITVVACLYIYFSVTLWLSSSLAVVPLGVCCVFAADILFIAKKQNAQVYEYPKRNFLYFCVALIIWLNLLTL